MTEGSDLSWYPASQNRVSVMEGSNCQEANEPCPETASGRYKAGGGHHAQVCCFCHNSDICSLDNKL